MNSKKTNYIVTILNVIAIVIPFLFNFIDDIFIENCVITTEGLRYMYDDSIVDFFLNNINTIFIIFLTGLGILNIICAIQNKSYKKLSFWQIAFGIYAISEAVVFATNDNVDEWLEIILYGIVPIIFAIRNLILIRKNCPKRIEIISYILVIIFSMLHLLVFETTYWNIVIVILQFIYVHIQEKNIEESKSRKIINIILYYILQSIVIIGLLFLIIYFLISAKINDNMLNKEFIQLNNELSTMQGIYDKTILVPVEKDKKYGYINENGKEIISCQYDGVSYFHEVKFNNHTYYMALVKKNNNYYIITKNNTPIKITGIFETCIKSIKEATSSMIKFANEDGNYGNLNVQYFSFPFQGILSHEEWKCEAQTIERIEFNEINLNEQDSIYYYNSNNFSMTIETVNKDTESFDYNSDDKYKVTITKRNGEKYSNIEYLPRI